MDACCSIKVAIYWAIQLLHIVAKAPFLPFPSIFAPVWFLTYPPLQNCVSEEIKAVFRLLRKKGGKPGGKPDIFIIILSLISNFHIVLIKYQLQRFLF